MTSFYWITRLDAIWNFSMAMVIVCSIVGTILLAVGLSDRHLANDKEDKDYILGTRIMRGGIWASVLALLFSLCVVFVPTTKEMCAIYVVDYLKDNEKVKQMPEQIIDAAAAFLEEQTKDKKEK